MNVSSHTTDALAQEPSVAIIGYGTAGVNALIALRTAGYKGLIRVFSNIATLPYSPILTSEYVGDKKAYEECFPWSAEELCALGADVIQEGPVVELDPTSHTIRTAQASYVYTKCVITSGASPINLNPEITDGYTPYVLKTMDDAERLKKALEEPECKRVLISGASLVALKTVEACLNHGKEVTLVGMSPHVLDFNALPEAAVRFEKGLTQKGVRLLLGQTITAVHVKNDDTQPLSPVVSITFSTGESEEFDALSVAHGMKCNLDFLEADALEKERALIVDDCMRTSDPDIYAAGDIVQADELISGQKRIVGIWKNAALQGACAGRAIAAELAGTELTKSAHYKGSISTNTIAVNGTLFISAGTMDLTPQRRLEIDEEDNMTIVRIIQSNDDGSEQLVGFNLVCDTDEEGGRAYDRGAMLTLRIEKPYLS